MMESSWARFSSTIAVPVYLPDLKPMEDVAHLQAGAEASVDQRLHHLP